VLLVSALIANTQATPLKLQAKHIINVGTQNTKLVLKVVNYRLGTHFKNGITVANLTSFVFSISHNVLHVTIVNLRLMKKELKEIKKNLKATLSGFKDAEKEYGYDLANETYYVKTALKQVNLLLLHDVVGRSEQLTAFVEYCENEHGLFIPSWMIDGYNKSR